MFSLSVHILFENKLFLTAFITHQKHIKPLQYLQRNMACLCLFQIRGLRKKVLVNLHQDHLPQL